MGNPIALDVLRARLMKRSSVDEASPELKGAKCRVWLRADNGRGYGLLYDGIRVRLTHRLSYEMHVGPIPEGLDVLHRCDRPGCLEPKHLWAGTHHENMLDKMAKGRGGHRKVSPFRGSKSPVAKLHEEEVQEIRRRFRLGQVRGIRPLAREFGVSPKTIRAIRANEVWQWLPAPLLDEGDALGHT